MIPCSCAASSASAICFAMGRASSIGMAPRAMRSARVGPRRVPGRAPARMLALSCRRARFFEAVDGRDVGMIQRGERLRFALEPCEPVGVAGEDSGRTFSATSRFSFSSRARYTSPMPPAPSAEATHMARVERQQQASRAALNAHHYGIPTRSRIALCRLKQFFGVREDAAVLAVSCLLGFLRCRLAFCHG